MRTLLLAAALFAVGAAGSANAWVTVVTFDSLTPDRSLVPDGYAGITWFGDWTVFSDEYAPYPPESPPNSVYAAITDAPFQFSFPVVFSGAYFAGYGDNQVTFDMYLGGNLVATSASLTPSGTETFLPSSYNGLVDKVVVVDTGTLDQYVMDNVTFTPEPTSLAVLATGLLGLGLRRRKRAK